MPHARPGKAAGCRYLAARTTKRAGEGEAGRVVCNQRPVVSRGGIWDIIQSSIAARIATAAPITTCTVIAVVPWKPNTQGETRAHKPTTRFSHSSHTANAASAAIARDCAAV